MSLNAAADGSERAIINAVKAMAARVGKHDSSVETENALHHSEWNTTLNIFRWDAFTMPKKNRTRDTEMCMWGRLS